MEDETPVATNFIILSEENKKRFKKFMDAENIKDGHSEAMSKLLDYYFEYSLQKKKLH